MLVAGEECEGGDFPLSSESFWVHESHSNHGGVGWARDSLGSRFSWFSCRGWGRGRALLSLRGSFPP